MAKSLGRKQIEARGFWRLTESVDQDREVLRQQIAAEVAAWEAAGNTIEQVPVGVSGMKHSNGLQYAKGQQNGLKKIKVSKEVEDDE